MIGSGGLASTAASVLLVSIVFGGAAPDPAIALAAERLAAASRATALAALDALEAVLEPPLDHARAGAALMVGGGETPGSRLLSAADAAGAARDEAHAAMRALADLNRARRAADPTAVALPGAVDAASVEAIADDLRDAAAPADVFAQMRGRTTSLLEHIEAALALVVRGGVDRARTELAAARVEHDALGSWAVASEPLAVWMATTDAMIRAVEARVDAVEAGHDEAEAAAIASFTRLTEEAGSADRALQIAISEGAGVVVGPVIERLGTARASVQQARAAVRAASERP